MTERSGAEAIGKGGGGNGVEIRKFD